MKHSVKKFYTAAYLVLTLLSLLLLAGTILSVVRGNTDLLTGGLAAGVFTVFALLQIVCLAIYKPGLSLYKIGFYLLHGGLLVMLVGFLAYALAGERLNVEVPVNRTGNFYKTVLNEENEEVQLGFGFRIDGFTQEKYESGGDKYYRADLTFIDLTTLKQTPEKLEVNHTLRQNGWKIYLMSYSDGESTLRSLYGLSKEQFYEIYSADGEKSGSELTAQIAGNLEGTDFTCFLYNSRVGGYVQTSTADLIDLSGSLKAYVLSMGDQAVIYIHPVSVLLLLKKDPGEFCVLAGIALVCVGAVFTCLIRGRKGASAEKTDEKAEKKERTLKGDPPKASLSKPSGGKGGRT